MKKINKIYAIIFMMSLSSQQAMTMESNSAVKMKIEIMRKEREAEAEQLRVAAAAEEEQLKQKQAAAALAAAAEEEQLRVAAAAAAAAAEEEQLRVTAEALAAELKQKQEEERIRVEKEVLEAAAAAAEEEQLRVAAERAAAQPEEKGEGEVDEEAYLTASEEYLDKLNSIKTKSQLMHSQSTQTDAPQLLVVDYGNQYNHNEKRRELQTFSKNGIEQDGIEQGGIEVENNKAIVELEKISEYLEDSLIQETNNNENAHNTEEYLQTDRIEVENNNGYENPTRISGLETKSEYSSEVLQGKIDTDKNTINTQAKQLADALNTLQASNKQLAADTAAGKDGRIWRGDTEKRGSALELISKVQGNIKTLQERIELSNQTAETITSNIKKYRGIIDIRNEKYKTMLDEQERLYKKTSSLRLLGFKKEESNQYNDQVGKNKAYLNDTDKLKLNINTLEGLLKTINTDSAEAGILNAQAQIDITKRNIASTWTRNSFTQTETEEELTKKLTEYDNDNIQLNKSLAKIAVDTNNMNALTKSLQNNTYYADKGTWLVGRKEDYQEQAKKEESELTEQVKNLKKYIASQSEKLEDLESKIKSLTDSDLNRMEEKFIEWKTKQGKLYKHQGYFSSTEAEKNTYNAASSNIEYYNTMIQKITQLSDKFNNTKNKQESAIEMAESAITDASKAIKDVQTAIWNVTYYEPVV